MRRAIMAIVFGIGGYLIGAALGYALVSNLSSNTHDRGVEAAMTSAFVIGPLCAIAAAIAGAALGRRT
jgi:hypothetical protein